MEEEEERRSSCEGRERDGGRTHYCGGLGCGGLTDPRPRGCRLNEGRVNGSLPPLGVATSRCSKSLSCRCAKNIR